MREYVLCVFLIFLIFNIVCYRTINIGHMLLGIYVVFACRSYVLGKGGDKILQHKEKNRTIDIIKSFGLSSVNSPLMNLRLPKKFRYIFVKADIIQNLNHLHFINIFSQELYIKLFILVERFYKIYYNILIKRYPKTKLDAMKMYFEDVQDLHSEIKYNIPNKSKNIRGVGQSLHAVADEQMNKILLNMKSKINMIISLNNRFF